MTVVIDPSSSRDVPRCFEDEDVKIKSRNDLQAPLPMNENMNEAYLAVCGGIWNSVVKAAPLALLENGSSQELRKLYQVVPWLSKKFVVSSSFGSNPTR
jgi:hypothetical protein